MKLPRDILQKLPLPAPRGPSESPVLTRRNRAIGVETTLSKEDEGWQTACEHGMTCSHRTRKLAEHHMAAPWGWCPLCEILRACRDLPPGEKASFDVSEEDPEQLQTLASHLRAQGLATYLSSGRLAVQGSTSAPKP